MSDQTADVNAGIVAADASPKEAPHAWATLDRSPFQACVRCGICINVCPTYVELGNESDGPRGRIQLMHAVVDGRLSLDADAQEHLDRCVQCGACEAACPYEVKYGRLFWSFRNLANTASIVPGRKQRFEQRLVPRVFSRPDRLRKWIRPTRLAQRFLLDRLLIGSGLWRVMPGRWGRLLTFLPRREKRSSQLPHVLPSKGKRRARVALFTGCMADALFRQLHWATARVLQENGCEVCVLRSQVCCGALHHQADHMEETRELIEQNTRTFNANDFDAIITNFATCGGFLKQYGSLDLRLLGGTDSPESIAARRRLSEKVRDVLDFLDSIGIIPPQGEIPVTATYHDACQAVNVQQVKDAPRRLLQKIPGLKLVEMQESELCCGSLGLYSFSQPAMADRLARRTLANVAQTDAQVVLTPDLMCLLHMSRAARMQKRRVRIVHPVHLLDLSYRGKRFRV